MTASISALFREILPSDLADLVKYTLGGQVELLNYLLLSGQVQWRGDDINWPFPSLFTQ